MNVSPSTTPSIPTFISRLPRISASRAMFRSLETACPIARLASMNFSLAPPGALRVNASCLAVVDGQTSRCLPMLAYLGHVYTADHNAFNCSARTVLNISRESMARYGFSPATRVFEAAGAAACLITDAWEGIDSFLKPDSEILVAHSGEDVARIVRELSEEQARAIGEAARKRVLASHTYEQRGKLVESILQNTLASLPSAAMEMRA